MLRLVAQGRTNGQIAKGHFISPKTASVQVTNILRKLDVTNRAAGRRVAHTVGLVGEKVCLSPYSRHRIAKIGSSPDSWRPS